MSELIKDNKDLRNALFILGFPRCASSTLAATLNTHPTILFPKNQKATNFYSSNEFEKGEKYLFDQYYPKITNELYFADGNPVNGILPITASRIFSLFPDAKLIFSMRDPIERAYSNWVHNVETGYEDKSFDTVIREELERNVSFRDGQEEYWAKHRERSLSGKETWRKNDRHYLFFGYYAYHLKNFLKYFPSSQIHLLQYEDLRRDSDSELSKISAFLNLDKALTYSNLEHKNLAIKNETFLRISSATKRLGILSMIPDQHRANIKKYLSSKLGRSRISRKTEQLMKNYYLDKQIELNQLLSEKFVGCDTIN